MESGLAWQPWRRGHEAIAVGFEDGKVAEKARELGPLERIREPGIVIRP